LLSKHDNSQRWHPRPPINPRKIQNHFWDLYKDLFEEFSKYSEIKSIKFATTSFSRFSLQLNVVISRWGMYKFREEELVANAVRNLTGRFYVNCLYIFFWFFAISHSFCNFEVHQWTPMPLCLLSLNIELVWWLAWV